MGITTVKTLDELVKEGAIELNFKALNTEEEAYDCIATHIANGNRSIVVHWQTDYGYIDLTDFLSIYGNEKDRLEALNNNNRIHTLRAFIHSDATECTFAIDFSYDYIEVPDDCSYYLVRNITVYEEREGKDWVTSFTINAKDHSEYGSVMYDINDQILEVKSFIEDDKIYNSIG